MLGVGCWVVGWGVSKTKNLNRGGGGGLILLITHTDTPNFYNILHLNFPCFSTTLNHISYGHPPPLMGCGASEVFCCYQPTCVVSQQS